MHAVAYNIENQHFAVDLRSVERVILAVESMPLPNSPDYVLGAINLHGEVVPLVNFRKLVEIPDKEIDLSDHFIICNVGSKKIALWVDQVQSVREYTEESLIPANQVLPDIKAVEYVIKENDRMILLYDLHKLLPHI